MHDPIGGSFVPPAYAYEHGSGPAAVILGAVSGEGVYPPEWTNVLFFGDMFKEFIRTLRPTGGSRGTVADFGLASALIVQYVRGPEGRIYWLTYGNGGQIIRLDHDDERRLSANASAEPSAVERGSATHLFVDVEVGDAVVSVRADLQAIGGAADQPLFNDGSHGDAVAGDDRWSLLVNIPPGAALGASTVPVVVSDTEGQVVSLNVSVTVQGVADTDSDGLSDHCETAFGLNPSSNAEHVSAGGDFDGDGVTNLQECNAGTHPRGFFARYFAEGATGAFFATRFAVANTRVDRSAQCDDLRHDGPRALPLPARRWRRHHRADGHRIR